MVKLGVNIDHVATLRQARKGVYPDPIQAAAICENAGCHSIVCHLREDRRHINDSDVRRLRQSIKTRMNLEMSLAAEIVDIACSTKPDMVTLVPEKRKELTTEGGLNLIGEKKRLKKSLPLFKNNGIEVSVFIDPDIDVIKASADLGVKIIELHTGEYANAVSGALVTRELIRLRKAADYALKLGMTVNAGHGLNYENTVNIAGINGMNELNIGHSIISYAVIYGLEKAVRDMLRFLL